MKAILNATILREKSEIRALFYRRFLFLPRMIIWRMRITCWIPKATNALTGCVILIAFPLQRWLHERTSDLHYKYIVFILKYCVRV
jgi:hypothetical protein